MRTKPGPGRRLAAAAVLLAAPLLMAADHADGPRSASDPDADLTDVYAWMSPDGSKVNLALDWFPNAPKNSQLASGVQFVFHVNSRQNFAAAPGDEQLVICTFDENQKISCWVGTKDFVTGDASSRAGLTSASGKVRVFAGVVDDPFFFNLTGFKDTAALVKTALPTLTTNAAGCPAIDGTTSQALVAQLSHGTAGADAQDDFAGKNVQTIVLSIDKGLLTDNGPILSVWASTNRP